MEKFAAAATTTVAFGRWEEVSVSTDKGRREMHYYLNRRDGTSDLAVVGREKGLRHMSYHYAIRDRSLLSILPSSSLLKLRSRREVIDWLNSIVQGTIIFVFFFISWSFFLANMCLFFCFSVFLLNKR